MELIVAVDKNWGIGKGNDLLFRISEDLKRFKAMTVGHAILVGKRTLDSFPGGKPLPNRTNIVLCFPEEECPPEVRKVTSVEEAVAVCREYDVVYVSGGESIYRQLLPYCQKAHVTKIHSAKDADRFFPNLDEDPSWQITDESPVQTQDSLQYSFITYERT